MIARRMPLHFAAALLITASLAGCSDEQAAAPRPAPAKVQVSAQTLRPQTVTLTAQLPGRTSAHMVSEVRPRVGGIVRTRNFDEGSDVKAGDILYELDPAPFEAAFRNAEAALQRANGAIPSATARLERYMNLTTRNAVSQQDLDEAQTTMLQAQADVAAAAAALETARINLEYTKIRRADRRPHRRVERHAGRARHCRSGDGTRNDPAACHDQCRCRSIQRQSVKFEESCRGKPDHHEWRICHRRVAS